MSAAPLLQVDGLVKHFPVRKGMFSRASGKVHAVDGADALVGGGSAFYLDTKVASERDSAVIIPLVLLDVFVTIYQTVCFPAYGIPKVRRRDYLIFDRHHLAYLNALEKFNCAYCSYANGLIAYVREIAGRTEQYWCPIKHARRAIGAHSAYATFEDYGDAEGYKKWLEQFQKNRPNP